MLIQTQTTPNPSTLKFLLEQPLSQTRSYDYENMDKAAKSLLAKRLFAIDGVERVFIAPDFISVSKTLDADWQYLKTLVLHCLGDFLLTGLPAVEEIIATAADTDAALLSQDPLIAQILELLDTRVRPAVEQDGGDIVFDRFEEGILYLELRGSCSGCPSSTATLKNGIENMMKHYIPEILEVRAA